MSWSHWTRRVETFYQHLRQCEFNTASSPASHQLNKIRLYQQQANIDLHHSRTMSRSGDLRALSGYWQNVNMQMLSFSGELQLTTSKSLLQRQSVRSCLQTGLSLKFVPSSSFSPRHQLVFPSNFMPVITKLPQ